MPAPDTVVVVLASGDEQVVSLAAKTEKEILPVGVGLVPDPTASVAASEAGTPEVIGVDVDWLIVVGDRRSNVLQAFSEAAPAAEIVAQFWIESP